MLEVISAFWSEYGGILLTGTRDTLVMVLISTICWDCLRALPSPLPSPTASAPAKP